MPYAVNNMATKISYLAKMRKDGYSVKIPKEVKELLKIQAGDLLDITIEKASSEE
jgi:bifunctional DNA-binding transcriptional regulator/antitoxin component of YhaV-PrlF toxin-antitoxin module